MLIVLRADPLPGLPSSSDPLRVAAKREWLHSLCSSRIAVSLICMELASTVGGRPFALHLEECQEPRSKGLTRCCATDALESQNLARGSRRARTSTQRESRGSSLALAAPLILLSSRAAINAAQNQQLEKLALGGALTFHLIESESSFSSVSLGRADFEGQTCSLWPTSAYQGWIIGSYEISCTLQEALRRRWK